MLRWSGELAACRARDDALAKKEQSEILYKVPLAVRLTEAAWGRVAGGWVNLT